MKRLRGLIGCLWIVGLTSSTAARAASQDFRLANRTGFQIDAIYVAEAGNREWGNDVLGRDALKPGERANISFDRSTRICLWDLRVRYHDATEVVWAGVDLCALKSVSLFWDPAARVTVARGD